MYGCLTTVFCSSNWLFVDKQTKGFPGGSAVKNAPVVVETPGSIPGSGKIPLEKEWLLCSCGLAWRI